MACCECRELNTLIMNAVTEMHQITTDMSLLMSLPETATERCNDYARLRDRHIHLRARIQVSREILEIHRAVFGCPGLSQAAGI